jgi:hypothetical protein
MTTIPKNATTIASVRELALHVTPGEDEAFAGYIDRYAVTLRATRLATLAALGLVSVPRVADVPPWYGVWLEPAAIDRFVVATGLSAAAIRRLLLSRYDGIALDFQSVPSPPDAGYAARIGWAYVAGSHYCPPCLAENGYVWKLAWKLPWSFVCVTHRCLLQTHCMECGRRAMTGRAQREGTPAHLGRVPILGTCAAHRGDSSYPGRNAEPCGAQYSLAPTITCDEPAVLDAQAFLDTAVAGGPVQCLGEPTSTLDFFGDLRAVVAAALLVRSGDAGQRSERRRGRSRWDGRFFTGVPSDASLLACVVPTALGVLRSESLYEGAALLAPVAKLALSTSGALPLPSGFRISNRVRRLLDEAADRRPSGVNSMRTVGERGLEVPLEARHIPQLLWEEVFDESFVALVPNMRSEKARLFCSLALAKWLFSTSWPATAELLELPAAKTAKIGYGVMGRIADAGTSARFASSIRSLAQALRDSGLRIDYADRRRALADLGSIDLAGWRAVAGGVRLSPARSQAAAAWLWSRITGCNHREAPAWGGEWTQTRRVAYARFLGSLPTLRPPLLAYQRATIGVPTNDDLISLLCLGSVGVDHGSG